MRLKLTEETITKIISDIDSNLNYIALCRRELNPNNLLHFLNTLIKLGDSFLDLQEVANILVGEDKVDLTTVLIKGANDTDKLLTYYEWKGGKNGKK
jgi:hypothetical protein